jgi:hypothetical protein
MGNAMLGQWGHMGFLIIVHSILINWDEVTRGARGLSQIPTATNPWIAFIWLAIAVYVALRLRNSPYGRAMIANGNPDTADHQAVYVPGTTAELGKVEGDINRMVNVWNTADANAGGQSVSTITWLGYDAPDSVVKDAPFEHYAYDGAPTLNHFLDGLEASHSGESEPHRTVIGHSYGTTLVGAAAQTGNLNADDVIFAGSPGVKVSGAEEMDVPKGHVWNEEADGDPVPDLGRWGHGGDYTVIPSDPEFGANEMTTDTEGHSGYWDEGSTSLLNQSLVVAGKGDQVALKPPPDPWAHVK